MVSVVPPYWFEWNVHTWQIVVRLTTSHTRTYTHIYVYRNPFSFSRWWWSHKLEMRAQPALNCDDNDNGDNSFLSMACECVNGLWLFIWFRRCFFFIKINSGLCWLFSVWRHTFLVSKKIDRQIICLNHMQHRSRSSINVTDVYSCTWTHLNK